MNRMGPFLRRLLEQVAGAILILLTLLTLVDVIGRYFIGQPIPGGHVLVQCLVCLLVFTGLPIIVMDEDYLCVQILDQRMTDRQRRFRDRAVTVTMIVALSVLAGQMFWQAGYFADNGEYFESIRIPLTWMAWYAAVTSTIAVVFAVLRLMSGAKKNDEGPA